MTPIVRQDSVLICAFLCPMDVVMISFAAIGKTSQTRRCWQGAITSLFYV